MNTRTAIIPLLLTALLAFSDKATPTEAPESVVTVANDVWPPFVENEGKSGLALDIVSAAMLTQGIRIEVTIKPWARAMKDVNDGKNDLLLATWSSPERQKSLLFSEPYLKNRLRFIKRAGDPFEYTGLNSLQGKRIGIVNDYSYTDEYARSDKFIREPHQDLQANLRMLAAKRLDLTVEDEIVASYRFYQLHLVDSYQFTGPPLTVKDLCVSSGRNNPKSQALIKAFNQGLKVIMDNGVYEQLLTHYGAMLHSKEMPEIIRPLNPAANYHAAPVSPMYASTVLPASRLNTR
ncbi:transporter substrate-binding domain-containing protein [Shewanella sp. A32]|uniref:transporter substrate-binding domain-containing protein n=1 Tax=Shewanella sp. A32 TaxID=3031327 RepID=UPI0023B995C7|nr:transporter substrate-binding domain-containing protein [Shewanella sp. A32]MDF0534794.1 transporter substrate-binding domain-containing protein [Shewanella sp. A32]